MQNKISHSQNFLRDVRLVEKLVNNASLKSDDKVLEIGPGEGILTAALAKRCRQVLAVEIDKGLSDTLKNNFSSSSNVEIYNKNFLDFLLPKDTYKVFSNIPFNITADIMRKLFDSANPPLDSYLIMQKEAAAKYGGFGCETLFSVLHKPLFSFSEVYEFQRSDFSPRPAVDIILLRVEKRANPLIESKNMTMFKDFISCGFASTRPNLKKAFKNIFGHVQFLRLAADYGFSALAKPTELTFDQWLEMFNYFVKNVEKFRQERIKGSYEKLLSRQKSLKKIHRTRIAKNWRKE